MKKAMIISCFDWYESRLKLVRETLIADGYETEVLLGDFDHIKKKKIEDMHIECRYIEQIKYKKNISFTRIMSHIKFAKDIDSEIKKSQPDLIYSLIPLNSIAKNCYHYKLHNPSVKLVFDVIDLWPESLPIGILKKLILAKKWGEWRNLAIQNADFIFTECVLYQELLSIDKQKTKTLYLYKDQCKKEEELVRTIVEHKVKENNKIVKFAYLGSINSIIDIEGICNVLKIFTDNGYQCEIHVIGKGEKKEVFFAALKETGCKVIYHGVIFDENEKIRILAPCDYAFNMMSKEVSVGLTIKSIDYLSCGLPLINNIKGDTWKFVEEKKIGINISESNNLNIDDFIKNMIDHNYIYEFFCSHFSRKKFVDDLKFGLRNIKEEV